MTVTDEVAGEGHSQSFVGSFFRHGSIYALAGILSQGISFLLFPFFAHVFAPHDYGIIDLIGLTMTLVNLTIALEISQGLGRYFIDARDFDEQREYASSAFTFTAGVYTVALAVGFVLIRPLTSLLLGSNVDTAIMEVGLAAIWCSGMLYLIQSMLRWQLRPKAFAGVSIVTAAATTASSAILVLGFHTGVIGALIGQVVGLGSAGLLAYWLSSDLYRLRIDRIKLRNMLAYSVPLMPSSIGVFLNGYADRIAIRSQLTLADVGLYGVAYRLSVVVSLTLLGFQGALLPLTLTHHENPEARRDLARIFRIFCTIGLAVFLCVSLFADELLRLLTRPAYYGAARVVPLVLAAAFFGGMYIFAPGLSIAKRTRPVALVFGVSGVVNVVLAFSLVGPLGIRGAAVAFLVSSAGSFVALMLISQSLYSVPHAWGVLLPTAAATAGLVALGRLLLTGTADPLVTLAKAAVAVFGLVLIARLLLTREDRLEMAGLPRRAIEAVRSIPRRAHLPGPGGTG